jgi:hypothetical protein
MLGLCEPQEHYVVCEGLYLGKNRRRSLGKCVWLGIPLAVNKYLRRRDRENKEGKQMKDECRKRI